MVIPCDVGGPCYRPPSSRMPRAIRGIIGEFLRHLAPCREFRAPRVVDVCPPHEGGTARIARMRTGTTGLVPATSAGVTCPATPPSSRIARARRGTIGLVPATLGVVTRFWPRTAETRRPSFRFSPAAAGCCEYVVLHDLRTAMSSRAPGEGYRDLRGVIAGSTGRDSARPDCFDAVRGVRHYSMP